MAAEYNGNKCVVECGNCDKEYVLGKANSQVYNFEDEGIVFVESTCSCGEEHDNFIDEEMLKFLKRKGVEILECEDPPVGLVRQWMNFHPDEWETVRTYELSGRQERTIAVLRWELEGVVTPQDILDVPIENRLPRRWS